MRSLPPTVVALAVFLTVLAACSDGSTGPTSVHSPPALLSSTDAETSLLSGNLTIDTGGHDPLEVVIRDGSLCFLLTFEGGGQFTQIHPETGGLVPGTPVRFPLDEGWVTLTSGPYSNNPSGPTIALYLSPSPGEIMFEVPIRSASLFYASTGPVTLDALDAAAGVVASASGPANVQPDGFTVWDPIGVDAGGNLITRAALVANVGGTGIDDLDVCLEASLTEITIDLKPGNADNAVDPFSLQSKQVLEVAALSSVDVAATGLDPLTVSLGDPELRIRIPARASSVSDVNGDGLDDVLFDFGLARDAGNAGALDANSTEVRLIGSWNGQWVSGTDAIAIVGGGL